MKPDLIGDVGRRRVGRLEAARPTHRDAHDRIIANSRSDCKRAIRSDDASLHAALFNIASATDPINFPQNGEYTEEDIREQLAVQEGHHHGGQQRVFGSWHPQGASFVMADGSFHFLNENMDVETYRRLGKRADGEPTSF